MSVTSAANSALSSALSNSSGGFSAAENNMLNQLSGEDKSRMQAQLALQKEQETTSFISNMLKKKNEIAMSIIGNLK